MSEEQQKQTQAPEQASEQENTAETAEQPQARHYVNVIDDHTREVANAVRKLADAMEQGRVHGIAIAIWGLAIMEEDHDPEDRPHSQNLMWENADPEIAGAMVPLLGSIGMLRTRIEHGLMNAQMRSEMPSPEEIMTLLQADTSRPQ